MATDNSVDANHTATDADLRDGDQNAAVSNFRLGLFGDTRSGKTMYLTSLYGSAQEGLLVKEVNLRPNPGSSMKHLNSRLGMIRAGRWPPGDLDIEPIELLLDYKGQTFSLRTRDFKGGNFGNLTEPTSKAEFEQFVNDLFNGCSAYIFLVDPGVVFRSQEPNLSPDEKYKREREALRVNSAVELALEKVRPSGRISHLMHRPVAIVFTKCDLYPDVTIAPAAFARKYLEPTCRYLDTHAPHRHAFFAVSSTGTLPEIACGNNPPPPRSLHPDNILNPILWCINQHLGRYRILNRFLIATLIVFLIAAYAGFYLWNGSRLGIISKAIVSAADGHLPELFRNADDLSRSFLMLPTHPFEGLRVRQCVVSEARKRFQSGVVQRIDGLGYLREVKDYQDLSPRVSIFISNYPGTADAQDLQIWLAGQRQSLAERLTLELEQLANAGQELNFDERQKQYREVAITQCDDRVNNARNVLNHTITRRKVSMLFSVRCDNEKDIAAVRAACKEAEDEINQLRRPETDKDVQYVRKIRKLYEQLNKDSSERAIYFTIRTQNSWKVKWDLFKNTLDANNSLRKCDDWSLTKVDPNDSDWYLLDSPKIKVDLFEVKTLFFRLEERDPKPWPWHNGEGQLNKSLREIQFGKYNKIISTKNTDYYLTFYEDDGIRSYLQDSDEIKRLEDELFRAEDPQ